MRLLLALLAVLIGLTACTSNGDDGPRPESLGVDASYALDGPLTCDSDVKEVPALPLEADPVSLLVCADPASTVPWTAPADVVEGDLGGLVQALSDLERAPAGDYACTMQAGPGYHLLLRFSRGRFARIEGDTGGCGVVTVASGEWFGAQRVLDAALALVERQRAATEPPAAIEPVDLDCNAGSRSGTGPPLSLTGEVGDVVRLVSCWQPNADELPPFPPGTRVRGDDVRTLAADLAANTVTGRRPPALRCPGGLDEHYFQHLHGQTRWGDLVAVYGECRRFSLPASVGTARWWVPSPASQRILDSLRDDHR